MKILIVGSGQVGNFLCERFSREGHEVTLVDHDQEAVDRAQDRLNVLGVVGNGASAEILEQAGIKDADIFIAVTNTDEVNILACLLAREYQAKVLIARTRNIEFTHHKAILSKEKLGIDLLARQHRVRRTLALVNQPELITLATDLGIDACISPRLAAAGAILKFVRRGDIVSMAALEGNNAEVLEIDIRHGSHHFNKPLTELHFPKGAMIGMIIRNHTYEIPTGTSVLQQGDRVIVFALPEAVAKVERFFA